MMQTTGVILYYSLLIWQQTAKASKGEMMHVYPEGQLILPVQRPQHASVIPDELETSRGSPGIQTPSLPETGGFAENLKHENIRWKMRFNSV